MRPRSRCKKDKFLINIFFFFSNKITYAVNIYQLLTLYNIL